MCRRNLNRRGFTLTEMLVVVGIIVVLMGVLLPAVMRARKSSRQAVCASNLRQIGALVLMYANANDDCIPLGVTAVYKEGDYEDPGSYLMRSDWTCYIVAWGQPSAGLGCLLYNGMLSAENAKILYCPTDGDETMTWNLRRGKFPPRGGPLPSGSIRISYFGRPVLGKLWRHTKLEPPEIALYWPEPMVKLDQMYGKAIYAERLMAPVSHGSEAVPLANVLYYDGSVRSVACNWVIPEGVTIGGYNTPDEPNPNAGTEPTGGGAEYLWSQFLDKH